MDISLGTTQMGTAWPRVPILALPYEANKKKKHGPQFLGREREKDADGEEGRARMGTRQPRSAHLHRPQTFSLGTMPIQFLPVTGCPNFEYIYGYKCILKYAYEL